MSTFLIQEICIGQFYINLTQARVIWENGILVETPSHTPQPAHTSDWPLASSMVHFHN